MEKRIRNAPARHAVRRLRAKMKNARDTTRLWSRPMRYAQSLTRMMPQERLRQNTQLLRRTLQLPGRMPH